MKMKEICARSGLTERAVRLYCEKGLVHPEKRWERGREYLEFTDHNLRELHTVSELRRAEFTLDEIALMLQKPDQCGNVLAGWRGRIDEQNQRLTSAKAKLAELSANEAQTAEQIAELLGTRAHGAAPYEGETFAEFCERESYSGTYSEEMQEISRKEEIDYLVKHGFNFSWEKSKYSINQGVWGTSIGGVETLSSSGYLPEEAYPSQKVKDGSEIVTLGFKKGELCSVNGEEMSPVQAIYKLKEIAEPYAIGRDTHVGDTIIGIKGRVGFEAAAPLIIIKAHHLLEKHVLTKNQLNWKDQLSNYYGQLMHEAQYLEPLSRDIEAFLESTQNTVTGTVQVQLMPYHFSVLGCESKYDMMSSKFGDYGEKNKSFSGRDIVGFTKVLANPLKIFYSLQEDKDNE